MCQTAEKEACYHARYHPDGTLDFTENPLGYQTRYLYNHHHISGLNEHVQCRACFDPLNRQMREVDDVYQRLVRRDLYEDERPFSSTHYAYGALGNLTEQLSQVMVEAGSNMNIK